jgi:hypothetical protein
LLDVVPAPIVIAKVDDKGTRTPGDDSLLRGASFAIHVDDGDGRYEAESDEVVWEGTADTGFLVVPAAPEGDYWIVETDAPTGFRTAAPILVEHVITSEPRNCVAVGERRTCVPDEDQSGGYLLVFVRDTPADLPPTDAQAGLAQDPTLPEGPDPVALIDRRLVASRPARTRG